MHADERRSMTGPLREGSNVVNVYNDGLVVFLYDQANETRIQEADPGILWGYGNDKEENAHPGTQAMLEAGAFLVYTLMQDDSVCAEICVGPPLGKAELAPLRWYPPQRARLSLPSGQLWVHSYNSLPIGDTPVDSGACMHLPPGDYVVTLHRKDWSAMQEEGLVDMDALYEEDIEVISEVLVLTPAQEALEPVGPPSILFFQP